MKLLVVVLCLLSERFLIHSVSFQRFSWFKNYCDSIKGITANHEHLNNPWVSLLVTIAPIIILVAIVFLIFQNVLFGFMGFIMSAIVFFYCLGPQNAFYPISDNDTEAQSGKYLADVNTQLFAVLFWYVVGGPVMALTYRLITLCRDISPFNEQAVQLTNILEWVPARLTALLYLLAGNFQQGIKSLKQFILAAPEANYEMICQAGLEAARSQTSEAVSMPVAETLVEHAAFIALVFLALFTLIAWL